MKIIFSYNITNNTKLHVYLDDDNPMTRNDYRYNYRGKNRSQVSQ